MLPIRRVPLTRKAVLPILRTPLVRPLVRVVERASMPAAFALLLLTAVSPDTAGFSVRVLAVLLVALFGPVMALAWLRGFSLDAAEYHRHAEQGHRFLCPRCLCLGGFDFACRECGHEVDPYLGVTNDEGAPVCARCESRLAGDGGSVDAGLRAACRRCGWQGDRAVFHERRVRVVGVVSPDDLREFCAGNPGLTWMPGAGYSAADDGECLTYVLDLSTVRDDIRSSHPWHATHALETLWLDHAAAAMRSLRPVLLSYIQLTQIPWPRRRTIAVYIRHPDPLFEVVNLLAAQFGAVRPRVEAARVMTGLPARETNASSLVQVHILGTLLPGDFGRLWAAMDEPRRWFKGNRWAAEETEYRVSWVLDMEAPAAVERAFGTSPSFHDLEALWLDLEGVEPLELGRALDRLIREGRLTDIARRRWVICVPQEQDKVERALHLVLDTRFGTIKYGISARTFLSRGARAERSFRRIAA